MAMMWLVYLSFLLRLTWSVRQNMSEKKNVNPKERGRQNAAILMRAYVHSETDVFVMCHSKWISWVPDSEFFLLIHKWMNLFGFFSVENYSSSVEFEEKNTQQFPDGKTGIRLSNDFGVSEMLFPNKFSCDSHLEFSFFLVGPKQTH